MDPRRVLAATLAKIGAVKRGRFRLSSGKISSIYIDLRIVPSHPRLFRLALSLLYSYSAWLLDDVDAVVGVATGGIPWATGLALLAGMPTGYVRPERKEHGRSRNVELDLPKGSRVLLVDDVATTGRSLLRAMETLRSEGYDVKAAVVVVDRGEGARERLAGAGILFKAVLTLEDLLGALAEERGD